MKGTTTLSDQWYITYRWMAAKSFPLKLPGGRDYLGPLYPIFLVL